MRKDKKSPQRMHPSNPTSDSTPPLGASLFSGIFQGFSFGAGSSIAHNIFRIPYTGASIHPSNEKESVCQTLTKEYVKACTEDLTEDPEKCKTMLKSLEFICQSDSKIVE